MSDRLKARIKRSGRILMLTVGADRVLRNIKPITDGRALQEYASD